ncbi:soluble pyridine nucleotide transhydrogenase [Anatilimnocola aggregata]|uniref:Soluble pyridine nucleotide transhydrogenase n=1 Tax=Anatilimnocola aggregata TaxID=2528021 RepID=A0A517YDI3_9BACT|nr:FAD-dependent oxidoreductase [Anatilimnocola aggregata]QDU28297.1 soluble pyridine nucleotide transhydrogenase [Anatilimnocola aggregata]
MNSLGVRLLLLSVVMLSTGTVLRAEEQAYDVVVVGGTPGGIAAAVTAGRLGRRVALVEYHDHLGGMSASGLGKSDVENRAMIGGLFQEFTQRIFAHYVKTYGTDSENAQLCREGYYFEPAVAEHVFEGLIREQPTIAVIKGARLKSAEVVEQCVRSIEVVSRGDGTALRLAAPVFIDATYEGDLYAAAGAEFRLGRESRAEFKEPHAGVVYFDYQKHEFLNGSSGAADERLPAYTYRLCLTTDPKNAQPLTEPPADYDRRNYLGYFDDLAAGRLAGPKVFKAGRGYNPAHFDTLVRALSVTEIPNGKTDVNINPRPLGFPFCEENKGYVGGDDATRQRICTRHRNLTLGLLWFLQHDEQVPAAHRELARQYHLPKDEFTDNGHFPFQLYVREARRLVGEYTLTEHDITGDGRDRRPRQQPDTVAVGEFPIDSFPCRKRQPGDDLVLEGYLGMLDYITRPYEIPYRIMIPKKIDGLIVPVAASTTHVAYSSIRMEPTWMSLGQAAGAAAHLAIKGDKSPRRVSIPDLQQLLKSQGQVLKHSEPKQPSK